MASVIAEAVETGTDERLPFADTVRSGRDIHNEYDDMLPKGVPPAQVRRPRTETLRDDGTSNRGRAAHNGAALMDESTPTAKPQDDCWEIRPPVRFNALRAPARQFELLQSFEGIVTSISDGVVDADLRDLTAPANPQEAVEIPLEEFPPADASLLEPGSVFYWVIGYVTSPGGQITRASEIRLQRTAKWSQRTLCDITNRAKELFSLMNDEQQ